MKYLTIFFSIILFSCERCNEMTIDHDVIKSYTETFVRAVGATERTSARGTLPQPSPSDANSIWVAPNGIDAPARGTQALPVLTVGYAIGLLGGALTTVHIFRNSYVGDIVITESGNIALPASNNLQVEDGEIAIVEIPPNNRLTLNNSCKVNGIYFRPTSTAFTSFAILCSSASSAEIKNCTIQTALFSYQESTLGASVGIDANQSTIIDYNVIISSYHGIDLQNAAVGDTGSISNNIFYGRITEIVNTVEDDIFLTGNTGIHSWANGSGITVEVDRSIFVNCRSAISDAGDTTTGSALTWDITNCNYYNVGTAFSARSNRAVAHTVNINFDYCKLNVIDGLVTAGVSVTAPVSSDLDVGVVITNTNPISTALPNMFQDLTEALDYNVEGFRLQHEGQTTLDGSGKYSLTSPLVGIGASSVDISPFDETVVFASIAFNNTMDINWPPAAMSINNLFANPANIRDVNGNLHIDYDKERRQIVFEFTDETHLSNLQMKELRYLLSDRGSKRFYPLGIAGNLFKENGSSQGTYLDTDDSFAPDDAVVMPMVVDWWRGFWINIAGEQFYINSNDETKMYLVDKNDLGFPTNGNYTFIVDSILITIEANSFNIKQNNFTQFTKGGFWRETSDDIRNYDYTISTITFEEIEDIEENV